MRYSPLAETPIHFSSPTTGEKTITTSVSAIDLKTTSTQKPKTRVRRTKAQWKALLEEYAISGLTQAEFCQKHHIILYI
jgi:hypothetical protein